MAVRAPGAVLEGVLVGVPDPGTGEGRASSVFGESAPAARALNASAPATAAGSGGTGPEGICVFGASGEASRVSTTTVLPVTAGAGTGAGAGAEFWADRASPGATGVTGAEVAVVTGGPEATTIKGPAREPRGGGEGAAGAP